MKKKFRLLIYLKRIMKACNKDQEIEEINYQIINK